MRSLWRWAIRLVALMLLVAAGLLSPVAYSEIMCRAEGEPTPYTSLTDPTEHRLETRTLMTYPEWHIVHAYEDYAHVISSGDPHQFDYLAAIRGFWRANCALSKASGQLGSVDGDTKQLVYVIGVSFTAELLAKAMYEETLGRLSAAICGPERAALDDLSAEQATDYAIFLRQVPWYKWDFAADAQALSDTATSGFRDRERRMALGLEYRAKAAYADVIAAAVAEVGADELTLRMIVTGATDDMLAGFEGVRVIGPTERGTQIETIRYRALTHLMRDMAQAGVDFVEIAGNDDIMFTIISHEPSHPKAIFSSARQGFEDHRHVVLTKVRELANDLRGIKSTSSRLEHIHDY
ncbi:hypothetical protein [Shimia ponticola]|uniref:hypothetical protein n=1 Tax=Shimia ponticola TaxID=2582893 RepID=UPI0011BF10C4|nr:hypothetical protein [Shimia ponticola]